MNQEKIGKFIAKNRKLKKLTQYELAEKLGVSDRTISNWENGKNMPDLSLFKPLCNILGITINELMSGEVIADKEYGEKLEENIINTIDYVNKKNINTSVCIVYLIVSILGFVITQFVIGYNELQNSLSLVFMILMIYSIKQLFIKYVFVRKMVAVILLVLCIILMLF